MDVVAHARSYEVVLVGIASVYQEFRHGITHRCLFDMLAERPPTEIPHFLEVLVGTIEEGHVLRHPFPRFTVGNSLHDGLVLHRVEVVNVVLVVVVTEESRSSRRFSDLRSECGVAISFGTGDDIGNSKRRLRFALAGIFEGSVPIGRRIDIRESAL